MVDVVYLSWVNVGNLNGKVLSRDREEIRKEAYAQIPLTISPKNGFGGIKIIN
jgi:hypothetical protein